MPVDSLDEALIYRNGSPFQRWAYEHAARYFNARGVRRYGMSNRGNPYAHLLHPEDSDLNFLSRSIAEAVSTRFDSHKAGDRVRAETNTVASQPCCFNLLVPLALDLLLASRVVSDWMGQAVVVEHIELEFTPNHRAELRGYELGERDESLGDQSGSSGTDADVAIFYRSGSQRGVLLIEFKYIEAEFSRCRSYNARSIVRRALLRPTCDSPTFVTLVTRAQGSRREQASCGYSRYRNWSLTQQSAVLDWKQISQLPRCPFSGSAQQLWRNLLLAENVARQRHLQQFAFWVFSPRRNDTLWTEGGRDVFQDAADLLRPAELRRLRRVEMETVIDSIEAHLDLSDERRTWWVKEFRERYLPLPTIVL